MPAGDGTGPYGRGSGTGWGNGLCRGLYQGKGMPVYGMGRGFRGRRSRGFNNGYYPETSEFHNEENFMDEKEFLEKRKTFLEKHIEAVERRIQEINQE